MSFKNATFFFEISKKYFKTYSQTLGDACRYILLHFIYMLVIKNIQDEQHELSMDARDQQGSK